MSWKRLTVVGLCTLLAGSVLGLGIGFTIKQMELEKEIRVIEETIRQEERQKLEALQGDEDETREDKKQEELPWYLTLVNDTHPMDEGYAPELTQLEPGQSVDSRIADAARKMLADAESAGLQVQICSSYRSVERQEQVFNESMNSRIEEGMSYWEAYRETSLNVADPGTSEHALGLALDLISNQYTELDERQETTKEAKWLAENCYKYGFILRYPPEKTDITGIIYEPWHYRYVGVEDATRIKELDVTLEEYLNEYY